VLTFSYTARNPATGQKVKATVQADSERAAAHLIQGQGLSPIDITLQKNTSGNAFSKPKTKDRVLFARQLATLINAGLPLVQSLRTVQRQTSKKAMQAVIGEIITDVEAGQNFSDTLRKKPDVFNNVFINLVAAGEVSGTLDHSLERLADQQEKDAEIVSKIRGAMVYPLIVVLVMVAVVTFMLVTVLPQVKTLYDGMSGAKLPFITQLLLTISGAIIHYWWIAVILVVLGVVFGTRWARTLGGKRVTDKLKMRGPLVSPLFMKMYMARFTRTGSTLVESGVPLIQMLEITGESVNNIYINESVARAISQVKGGKSLADALEGDPNFLELVPNMLRIGEQSGSVEKMMAKTADYYEKEVDNQIKAVSTIIEPVLMIVLGVVALIIVGAVLMPIYGLAGKNLAG